MSRGTAQLQLLSTLIFPMGNAWEPAGLSPITVQMENRKMNLEIKARRGTLTTPCRLAVAPATVLQCPPTVSDMNQLGGALRTCETPSGGLRENETSGDKPKTLRLYKF